MSTKPPVTAEDEEEKPDELKESSDNLEKAFQEEVPEMAMGSFALQFMTGLGLGVVADRWVVGQAYKLLKKPLDPKKLLTDSLYRKKVTDALALVQKREKKQIEKGKSPFAQTIEKTNLALGQVKATQTKLEEAWGRISKQFGNEVGRIYGLGDKELETVYKNALQRMKDYPGEFSLREAIRIEARNVSLVKTVEEVKADASIPDREKEEIINKRVQDLKLDQKDVLFIQDGNTVKIHQDEKGQTQKITEEGIQKIGDVFAGQPATQPPPQSVSIPSAPVSLPNILDSSSKVKNLSSNLLQNSARLHALRLSLRNAAAFALRSMRGLGMRSLAKFALPLFKTGISAALSVASLGSSLLFQAGLELAKSIPIIGGVIEAGEEAVFGTLKYAVLVILLFAIGLPVIFILFFNSASTTIPSFGAQNATSVSLINRQNLTWEKFEKEFLTLNPDRHNKVQK